MVFQIRQIDQTYQNCYAPVTDCHGFETCMEATSFYSGVSSHAFPPRKRMFTSKKRKRELYILNLMPFMQIASETSFIGF